MCGMMAFVCACSQVYEFTYVNVHVCSCVWNPEHNVECLLLSLSTLFTEAGFLTEPRAHQFG